MDAKLVEKVKRFCAFRERSELEVRRKATTLGCSQEESDVLLRELVDQGFVDNARFAESYVYGHVRDKRWGPVRLRQGLRERGVSSSMADAAIGEVEDLVWQTNLKELLGQRPKPTADPERARLLRWLQGKGYRMEQILQALDDGPLRRTFAQHDHD